MHPLCIYRYIYRVITTGFILTTIAHWGSVSNLSWIYFLGPSFVVNNMSFQKMGQSEGVHPSEEKYFKSILKTMGA